MTYSSDEFEIESLNEMFPDLNASDDQQSLPLEMAGNFGQGSLLRHPPAYTDTHLCAMFIDYKCRHCDHHTLAPQNYAVRRISNNRSQCIDYQVITWDQMHLFDHLPRYKYHYQHHADFCNECLPSDYEREEIP